MLSSRLTLVLLFLGVSTLAVRAQTPVERRSAVQVVDGHLRPLTGVSFFAPGLKAGDRLEVRVAGTSGNLDPFVVVCKSEPPLSSLAESIGERLHAVSLSGANTYDEWGVLSAETFVAYDDDSGPGYDARALGNVPEDGDYRVVVSGGTDLAALGALSARRTFGDYRMTVGLNSPLGRSPVPSGSRIVSKEQADRPISIHRIADWVSAERPSITYSLKDLQWGESLKVHLTVVGEGGMAPRVRLLDYGGKELAHANVLGNQPTAEFLHSFTGRASKHSLLVEGVAPEQTKFTMVLGRGTRQRLGEETEEQGEQLIVVPIQVNVGFALEQITFVNQKEENFGAVATVRLEWDDPDLAFRADSCNCEKKIFDLADFEDVVRKGGVTWPQFIIKNQQGNRWVQERLIQLETSGRVIYYETFTTTLQAPEFDFRDFPMDEQEFFVHIKCLRPREEFRFVADTGHSSLGNKLGEEEWVMGDFVAEPEDAGRTAGMAFRFQARRQLVYYTLRLLIPICLIVLIGWLSFLINDYNKRIDISSGNLLAFIAFNFSISSDLPRLGYVTFVDMLLMVTFVVCAILVALNVHFMRQERLGNADKIARIDRWVVVIYPFAFLIPPLTVYILAQSPW